MAETPLLHHSTDPFADGEHNGHDPAAPSSDVATCGADGGIPVVDFDVLVNGTADRRAWAIRDLGRACEDWGFFMVRLELWLARCVLPATYKTLVSIR